MITLTGELSCFKNSAGAVTLRGVREIKFQGLLLTIVFATIEKECESPYQQFEVLEIQ